MLQELLVDVLQDPGSWEGCVVIQVKPGGTRFNLFHSDENMVDDEVASILEDTLDGLHCDMQENSEGADDGQ
jgi:hypothetical protein